MYTYHNFGYGNFSIFITSILTKITISIVNDCNHENLYAIAGLLVGSIKFKDICQVSSDESRVISVPSSNSNTGFRL